MSFHYLKMTSFGDAGGGHWYGSIRVEGNDVIYRHDLHYDMTEEQALKFNKGDPTGLYEAGQETTRFWSRQEVLSAAVAKFEMKKKPADVLVIGDPIHSDEPFIVVAGRPLYVIADANDWVRRWWAVPETCPVPVAFDDARERQIERTRDAIRAEYIELLG